ncbi:MAG: diacylglycerol kinase family protein, partial [Myxococcota bacterium]
RSAGEATDLTRTALHSGVRWIVAVGGDGTCNEVVNGFFDPEGNLISADAGFCFYPSGTGSDLQRSISTADTVGALVHALRRERRRWLDVGRLRFEDEKGSEQIRYFLNIASFGMSSLACRIASRRWLRRLHGRLAFSLGSILGFLGFGNRRFQISMNGGPWKEWSMRLGVIANGRSFGGGMQIAPQALMEDGHFDVILFDRFSLLRLLWHFPKVFRGAHLTLSGVCSFQVEQIEVKATGRVWFEVEGEVPGVLPLSCSLMPRALPVLEVTC